MTAVIVRIQSILVQTLIFTSQLFHIFGFATPFIERVSMAIPRIGSGGGWSIGRCSAPFSRSAAFQTIIDLVNHKNLNYSHSRAPNPRHTTASTAFILCMLCLPVEITLARSSHTKYQHWIQEMMWNSQAMLRCCKFSQMWGKHDAVFAYVCPCFRRYEYHSDQKFKLPGKNYQRALIFFTLLVMNVNDTVLCAYQFALLLSVLSCISSFVTFTIKFENCCYLP